ESSNSAVMRKTTKEPEKQSVKKIRVNITKQADKRLLSYVWDYFEVENGCDICKIVVLKKGVEDECGTDYKHDGGTSNMKFHLQTKHGILGPNDLKSNPSKRQLQINEMIRKVPPHKETIQTELKRITAEWLVTDSLPFNVIHKE
ncbi:15466_t:CDS:1, partial [Cetraspora pellucida]